jgi:hypothetical protein
MTSPPPAAPQGRHREQRGARIAGITRIVQTEDLPAGVDALASADGKTIIVRASLDQFSRRRAMREVLDSIRRFPRLALVPALSVEAIRGAIRRVVVGTSSASQSVQQLVTGVGDHASGLAMAVTATIGTAAVVTAVVVTASPDPDNGAPGGGAAGAPARIGEAQAGPRHAVHASLIRRPLHYLGVYEPGVPQTYQPIAGFATATQQHPNIALYYSSWNEKFQLNFADAAYQEGATPAVQIEPFGVSLTDIAAGRYDSYLRLYASQIMAYGRPVIIGFAHEPNGNWYRWGPQFVSPPTWVEAWRHVVDVFRNAGADNVTWLWTVNSQGNYGQMAAAWWPGADYVTWIGIDGYFTAPGQTFDGIFGGVLRVVKALGKPILISETAVGPATGNQPAAIGNLFNGLRANQLLGLIWFDVAQAGGQFHQDWRLEGDPRALAAFSKDVNYISS